MPNIKSAKKRILVSARRKEENTLLNSSLKTAVKKTEKAISENNKEKAQEEFKIASRRIDKAVNKKLVHKNKAARLKSRLSKAINKEG